MKKVILYIFVLGVFLLGFSCNDDDSCDCDGEIIGKWEAKDFMSVESFYYAKLDDQNPTITFKSDGTYDIFLDVNSCFGDFDLLGENKIQIAGAGCTEACCDSDFSEKFVEMLSQVTSFEIEGDALRLYVSDWGWIKLEWISN